MIRVVLDANIFVSTVLKSHSNAAKVFQLAKKGKVTPNFIKGHPRGSKGRPLICQTAETAPPHAKRD
jgi:hypothetical protein